MDQICSGSHCSWSRPFAIYHSTANQYNLGRDFKNEKHSYYGIQALDEHGLEQQVATRLEIKKLRATREERMKDLREDMENKHMQLHLLQAANMNHNAKQRGGFQERSKAISAALVAYQVIYENLQVNRFDTCRSVGVPLMSSRHYSRLYNLRPIRDSLLKLLKTFGEYHLILLLSYPLLSSAIWDTLRWVILPRSSRLPCRQIIVTTTFRLSAMRCSVVWCTSGGPRIPIQCTSMNSHRKSNHSSNCVYECLLFLASNSKGTASCG